MENILFSLACVSHSVWDRKHNKAPIYKTNDPTNKFLQPWIYFVILFACWHRKGSATRKANSSG